jgi:ABC-type transport system involved in Fe-S cluster assembly fused permease/ATPase subunit
VRAGDDLLQAFTAEKFEIRRYAHAVDQYNLQQVIECCRVVLNVNDALLALQTISNASQQILGFGQQVMHIDDVVTCVTSSLWVAFARRWHALRAATRRAPHCQRRSHAW